MSDVCGSDYTSAELRIWLQSLGLSSTGTKSAMLVRLNDVPADQRGECPAAVGGRSDVAIVEENECISEGACRPANEGEGHTKDCEKKTKKSEEILGLVSLLRKELDLIKREKELLQKDSDLMKMIPGTENEINMPKVDDKVKASQQENGCQNSSA